MQTYESKLKVRGYIETNLFCRIMLIDFLFSNTV
jgi:hypothetical protein